MGFVDNRSTPRGEEESLESRVSIPPEALQGFELILPQIALLTLAYRFCNPEHVLHLHKLITDYDFIV